LIVLKNKYDLQNKIFRNDNRFSIESVDDKIVFNRAIADHLCLEITAIFNCSRITMKTFDSLLLV